MLQESPYQVDLNTFPLKNIIYNMKRLPTYIEQIYSLFFSFYTSIKYLLKSLYIRVKGFNGHNVYRIYMPINQRNLHTKKINFYLKAAWEFTFPRFRI